MIRQDIAVEFDELPGFQRPENCGEIGTQQSFQFRVANIAGGDQKQLLGPSGYQVRLHEIIILGHNNALLALGNIKDDRVRGAIAQRQIQGMYYIMTGIPQQ